MTDTATFEPASVSHRTLMWKRQGTVYATPPANAEEAIREAGLDWHVELRDLGFKSPKGSHFIKVPGHFVTVRTDTETALGTVRSRYKPFTNTEAFAFADNLVDSGGLFECGWEQGNGRKVGLTMRLPGTITVGGEDVFNHYLMLSTTHDGSGSIHAAISMERMNCLNQWNATLRRAIRRWSVVHSVKASTRLQQAREALEIAFKYDAEFQAEMEQLMTQQVSHKSAAVYLQSTLKANRVSDESAADISATILSNWFNSPTIQDDQRNTAYGLLNATTEYFDHIRQYRTPEAAIRVTTEGLGARTVQQLSNLLTV